MSGRLQVSDSFILMAALAGFLDEGGIVKLFFAAAALHEFGHALAVWMCGGELLCLRLTAIGGVLRYRLPGISAWRDFCIAAAGPFIGFCGAWLSAGLGFYEFAGANLLLSLLNLLPVRPLDGGEMLRILVSGEHVRVLLEAVICIVLEGVSALLIYRGGGWSLMLLTGALVANLQNNLQKCKK